MKNLILAVLLVIGFGFTTNAQTVKTMALAAGDTAVDAGTSAKVLPVLSKGYAGVAVQVRLTRNSGTAGGSLVVQGSLDGSNWTTIGSAFTPTNVASQSTMFYISEPVPYYVRTLLTGTGTMNVTQTVRYILRTHD